MINYIFEILRKRQAEKLRMKRFAESLDGYFSDWEVDEKHNAVEKLVHGSTIHSIRFECNALADWDYTGNIKPFVSLLSEKERALVGKKVKSLIKAANLKSKKDKRDELLELIEARGVTFQK